MKKALFLLLSIGIVFNFLSCTSKKNRLSVDTLNITIDPGSVIANKGAQVTLKALATSAQSTDPDISPTWTIDNINLGTISPATGKTVTFTAGTTLGTSVIYAQYGSIRASVGVTVGDLTPNSVPNDMYGVFIEQMMLSSAHKLLFDVYNSSTDVANSNPDGGYAGQFNWAVMSDAYGAGEYSEGSKGLKVVVAASGGGCGWGGIYMQFGYQSPSSTNKVPTDMSRFSGGYLKFDLRTTKEVGVKIDDLPAADVYATTYGAVLDDKWHSVSIPLTVFTDIDLNAIEALFIILSDGDTNFTFYVDNIRWEK
ncbi:hypothetical protein ACFL58_00570 [Elusimicrobiota bacterium]